MKQVSFIFIFIMAILSGCASNAPQPVAVSTATEAPTTQPSATSTDVPARTPTTAPTATETKMPSLTITPLAEGRTIIKETSGLPITGRVYGHGETAVILASVGGTSESQWDFFAKYLAENGFTSLALSSPESQGDTAVLVRQGIEFLRQNGYRRIVCAGASNGASGCAFNVENPEITGLLLITYHGAANLTQVEVPKLFITGEQTEPWRDMTEAGFKAAGEPKELIVVPNTSGNGPSILEIDQDIKQKVLEFLKMCNGL